MSSYLMRVDKGRSRAALVRCRGSEERSRGSSRRGEGRAKNDREGYASKGANLLMGCNRRLVTVESGRGGEKRSVA